MVQVMIPCGANPGDTFRVQLDNQQVTLTVPLGSRPGDHLQVRVVNLHASDTVTRGNRSDDAAEDKNTHARDDILGAAMKVEGFDITTTPCGPRGWPALWFALGTKGDDHDADAVKLALAAAGVNVNELTARGETFLLMQCGWGRNRNVKLLLADPRVDVNLACDDGTTPLHAAALAGMDRCVEALLADERVDVERLDARGVTPLEMACSQLTLSMDQVGVAGGNDPARTLVLVLKSRRITPQCLAHGIAWLRSCMPTPREVASAEAGGAPLRGFHQMARLVLPILQAHARGHFRWCGHCLDLTPDQDLDRCGGCNQVGYCPLPYKAGDPVLKYQDVGKAALPAQVPCHKAHWKAGHKKECARFAAEAKTAAEAGAGAGGGGGSGGSGGGGGGAGGGESGSGGQWQGRWQGGERERRWPIGALASAAAVDQPDVAFRVEALTTLMSLCAEKAENRVPLWQHDKVRAALLGGAAAGQPEDARVAALSALCMLTMQPSLYPSMVQAGVRELLYEARTLQCSARDMFDRAFQRLVGVTTSGGGGRGGGKGGGKGGGGGGNTKPKGKGKKGKKNRRR
jgi:hypothetical protein